MISLRVHFLLIFIGLAICPILLVALISGQTSIQTSEQQNRANLHANALRVRDKVEALAAQAEQDIHYLEKVSRITTASDEQRFRVLDALLLISAN